MAITSDQLKFYKSMYVNDALTNGGRKGTTLITDGALNNLFRNIQSSERDAGIVLYRKFFLQNENPNDLALENTKMYISNVSSGEDYFTISPGADSDNQSVADDYTDWYGSGVLKQDLLSGEASFSATFKGAYGLPSGCSLVLNDGLNSLEIAMSGEVTWNGFDATVPISSDGREINFLATETIVSAVLELGNITPSVINWLVNSSEGVFDDTNYPLTTYNIGTITESWTLTFSSTTAFEVSGTVTGSVGVGSTLSNFAPVNGGGYYFLLDKNGFSGSWISGDTITFRTVHAAKGIWMKEDVPTGCASQSNNLVNLKLKGESA